MKLSKVVESTIEANLEEVVHDDDYVDVELRPASSSSPKEIPAPSSSFLTRLVTHNPMHRVPTHEHSTSVMLAEDHEEENRRIGLGLRTVCTASILFFGGFVMFIVGCIYYWHYEQSEGMDIMIVGAVMLLPGSYGMTIVTGYFLKWPGYEADRLPLFD